MFLLRGSGTEVAVLRISSGSGRVPVGIATVTWVRFVVTELGA